MYEVEESHSAVSVSSYHPVTEHTVHNANVAIDHGVVERRYEGTVVVNDYHQYEVGHHSVQYGTSWIVTQQSQLQNGRIAEWYVQDPPQFVDNTHFVRVRVQDLSLEQVRGRVYSHQAAPAPSSYGYQGGSY